MANGSVATEALGRPTVSVVVPFLGTADQARTMLGYVSQLDLRSGDEVIVADNTADNVVAGLAPDAVRVIHAAEEGSAYYPRNVAADLASGEWLLFTDADCIPVPGLLDAYFAEEITSACGALAGEVEAEGDDLLARYAESRGLLSPKSLLAHPYLPAAATANLMVRRAAWSALGGFLEGVKSDSDTDFCWRLQEAGWTLEFRPGAAVRHVHRQTLRALAKQAHGYGAGMAWLTRRYPGSRGAPPLVTALARCAVGVVVWSLTARFERAAFKAIDAVLMTASAVGRLTSNAADHPGLAAGPPEGLTVLCDAFPRLSETFVVDEIQALRRHGYSVRVEAEARPARPALGATRGLRVSYREDDTIVDRLRSLAWLITRHPVRAARVAAARPRWINGGDRVTRLASIALVARRVAANHDRHVHAQFALTAALDALRLHQLLGIPYSLTAHAHDIYAEPANLAEKLDQAKFSTTVCEYNAAQLRSLLSPDAGERLQMIPMGVDAARFRRSVPLSGGRTVVGVGRLVEQKGFAHLLGAIASLEATAPVGRVVLVGDGPLRASLETLASEAGIGPKVDFMGSREPAELPAILEQADLLVMPSVIAADGARDAVPVVVREGLAMELMVAGTDVAGLPEVIQPAWGRVVPAGDEAALAEAIRDLLSLPKDRRVEMGAAAREFVIATADPDNQALELGSLMGLTPQLDHREAVAHGGTPDSPDLDEVVKE